MSSGDSLVYFLRYQPEIRTEDTTSVSFLVDGNFDSILTVYDENGDAVEFSDDYDGFNPGIVGFVLEPHVKYSLRIEGYSHESAGEFEIRVEEIGVPLNAIQFGASSLSFQPDIVEDNTILTYPLAYSVPGFIDRGRRVRYRLELPDTNEDNEPFLC